MFFVSIMKRILVILTVIFAASLMIGSVSAEGIFDIFSSSSNSGNNESNFIVGFNPEFPPFTYKDDGGNFTGFDLELAQEVAKRNNWTFVPQPIIDWNSKEVEINLSENKAKLLFANPSKSNQDMMLQIVIQDEVILQSGIISPGYQVKSLDLFDDVQLSEGNYEGKFVVYYYQKDTGEKAMLNTEIPLLISVKK